jgi:hypothetical protein
MSEEKSINPFNKRLKASPEAKRRMAEHQALSAVDDLSAWKSIYQLSIELRNFEISQLVQRNNFFMIFQGVLLAGICQSPGQVPVVSLVICVVGALVALLQAGMAAGAKYWQEHWELNTTASENAMVELLKRHRVMRYIMSRQKMSIDKGIENRLLNRQAFVTLFGEDSNRNKIREGLKKSRPKAFLLNELIMMRFSTSRIPIYVGLVLAAGWLTLLICTFRIPGIDWHILEGVTGFKQS